ncbi:MAG TPA: AAA family ATPase, partial [Kofleriaceae bacterium]
MARRLPRLTTRMVGRSGDLARLRARLERHRLAVVAGMPGVGKSTLALAYAEAWAEAGTGPVCWIAVARASSIAALAGEVSRQLEVAHYDQDADDDPRLAELMARIDRERALVVLDDLHALADAPRARLLAAARRGLGRGRWIATSRERCDAALVLAPLDRAAAAELCAGLVALFGPGLAFERAWGVSRGNPFLLRQAHIGAVGDLNPLDDAYAGLDGDTRVLALALALASAPLP